MTTSRVSYAMVWICVIGCGTRISGKEEEEKREEEEERSGGGGTTRVRRGYAGVIKWILSGTFKNNRKYLEIISSIKNKKILCF